MYVYGFFLQEKMATQMSSAPAFDALVLKWLHRISRKRNDGNAERKESKHSQTGERKRFFLLFFALLELPKILARQSAPVIFDFGLLCKYSTVVVSGSIYVDTRTVHEYW